MTPTRYTGRPGDFDFLTGCWHVANRRLRRRLAGCTDWDSFDGHLQALRLMDGALSVDEMRMPTLGLTGCSVRTLEREAGHWSIYWIDSTTGRLTPPVHGGFHGEHGVFTGQDVDEGRAVQVRFDWTRGPDVARWEQAFSLDGQAWETNWVMVFQRA